MSAAHVYAPQATDVVAIKNVRCIARAPSRQCGSRWALAKYTPWLGWDATCYHCGARYGEDGELLGTSSMAHVLRVRAEFDAVTKKAAP